MIFLRNSPEYATELKIIESAGGPRTGKGTITKHLGNAYVGAQTDETGADYRAVTAGLRSKGKLEQGMDAETVKKIVLATTSEEIIDLASRRYELVASLGESALHTEEINSLVGLVSPYPHVRDSVKKGFAARVRHQRDIGTTLLVVDGRNLGPVISEIERVSLVLRLFVDCQVAVAVIREAVRRNVDLSDPSNQEWFNNEYRMIQDRRTVDEIRGEDPAIKDPDAINYWYNGDITRETARVFAQRNSITESQAALLLMSPDHIRKGGRIGAGAIAVAQNRQIYFDTTEIGVDDMRDYAKRMADEALDAYSAKQKLA